MPEIDNNGGGAQVVQPTANVGEFTPSPEFLEQFKGWENQQDPNGQPFQQVATPGKKDDQQQQTNVDANAQKTPEQLKTEEDEKINKMSPEEKEAYLKGKETSGAQDDPNKGNPPPAKTFEEQLADHFEGKYKSVEELKAVLNAPKEAEFANDTVKFFNELIKSGTVKDIDAEYVRAITMDYENMESANDILTEHLRQTDPKLKGADNEEMDLEIRLRYRMNEWAAEGEEKTEVQRMMEKRMARDAEAARDEMITKRESLKFIKTPDPQDLEKAAQEKQQNQKKFETFVDTEIAGKITKLSSQISDKEAFDYKLDQKEIGEVAGLMKLMNSDVRVFWNQFVDKGVFQHAKVAEMMLRHRNYDKAIKLARADGEAIGEERAAKKIKNIDFTGNTQPNVTGVQTQEQAIAASLRQTL